MNSIIEKKCPNIDCNGNVEMKYYSNDLKLKNINFNCTTDSYTKPNILKCQNCNIIFSELIYELNESQFEKNYQEVKDLKYISQIKYKKVYFNKFCKKISNELNKQIDVLEIGSYYGVLGSIIKDKVKNYSGLELSKHGSDYSKKEFQLNIFNETIEEHSKRGIKYDLIVMADVIEHFSDPFKVFKIMSKILNKNGKVILTTFNIDSLYAKFTGKNYHWIIPYHLVFFSNKTLDKLGNDNNLNLYRVENDPRYTSIKYLLEKLKLIFPKFSFIFNFLSKVKLLDNMTIKVNLRDLNIYYFVKR